MSGDEDRQPSGPFVSAAAVKSTSAASWNAVRTNWAKKSVREISLAVVTKLLKSIVALR